VGTLHPLLGLNRYSPDLPPLPGECKGTEVRTFSIDHSYFNSASVGALARNPPPILRREKGEPPDSFYDFPKISSYFPSMDVSASRIRPANLHLLLLLRAMECAAFSALFPFSYEQQSKMELHESGLFLVLTRGYWRTDLR